MMRFFAVLLFVGCNASARPSDVDSAGGMPTGIPGTGTSGDPSDSTAAASGAAGETTENTTGDDHGVVFDLGSGGVVCPEPTQMPNDSEIVGSYIWIANSSQGTVSKINTETLVEEGRYGMGPDTMGVGENRFDADPSRTTVSPAGDVAVGDRKGRVVKVLAVPEACPDLDRDGTITTSTGKDDILPWGEDECVAWSWGEDEGADGGYHERLHYVRGLGWTREAVWNPDECVWEYELWASSPTGSGHKVFLLAGSNGALKETVSVVGFDESTTGVEFYGGAVDADGNFWTHQKGRCHCALDHDNDNNATGAECAALGGEWRCPQLAYVSYETLESKTWTYPGPGYGITVDSVGHVWICSATVHRFDPATETFTSADVGGGGGCMADGSGRVWTAGGLRGIDIETMEVVMTAMLPHGAHGVSVDHKGRIWGVPVSDGRASRWDPVTGEVGTYDGLDRPYTYSDMTGVALLNAGSIPVDPAG